MVKLNYSEELKEPQIQAERLRICLIIKNYRLKAKQHVKCNFSCFKKKRFSYLHRKEFRRNLLDKLNLQFIQCSCQKRDIWNSWGNLLTKESSLRFGIDLPGHKKRNQFSCQQELSTQKNRHSSIRGTFGIFLPFWFPLCDLEKASVVTMCRFKRDQGA